LDLFARADVMTDVVECWNWLLSACPSQELVFLQEMISAWHHTRAARLGLFHTHTEEAGDPLAPTEVYIPFQVDSRRVGGLTHDPIYFYFT
jgi:hypothetical protein